MYRLMVAQYGPDAAEEFFSRGPRLELLLTSPETFLAQTNAFFARHQPRADAATRTAELLPELQALVRESTASDRSHPAYFAVLDLAYRQTAALGRERVLAESRNISENRAIDVARSATQIFSTWRQAEVTFGGRRSPPDRSPSSTRGRGSPLKGGRSPLRRRTSPPRGTYRLRSWQEVRAAVPSVDLHQEGLRVREIVQRLPVRPIHVKAPNLTFGDDELDKDGTALHPTLLIRARHGLDLTPARYPWPARLNFEQARLRFADHAINKAGADLVSTRVVGLGQAREDLTFPIVWFPWRMLGHADQCSGAHGRM